MLQCTSTDRLLDWYGISGHAQIWLSSYLENRHYSKKIKESLSDKATLSYGVPQGSLLGPVLFTFYTTTLNAIISSFDIKGVVNCQNSRDKGPPEGNSARG